MNTGRLIYVVEVGSNEFRFDSEEESITFATQCKTHTIKSKYSSLARVRVYVYSEDEYKKEYPEITEAAEKEEE